MIGLVTSIEKYDISLLQDLEVSLSLGSGDVAVNFVVISMDSNMLRGHAIK